MAVASAVSNEAITERPEGPARPSPDPKGSRNHNAEKNGSGATKGTETASNARFFLTKRGSYGKPEVMANRN